MSTQYASQLQVGPPVVPATVRNASTLWFAAVGAGALEAGLAVVGMPADGSASVADLAPGLGFRLVVFAVAIFMATHLRRGRGWARIALALTLGVFGTLSLVMEPIQWWLDGNSVVQAVADADAMTFVSATTRVLHLAAVLAAMALMFGPTANAYFRGASRSSRDR